MFSREMCPTRDVCDNTSSPQITLYPTGMPNLAKKFKWYFRRPMLHKKLVNCNMTLARGEREGGGRGYFSPFMVYGRQWVRANLSICSCWAADPWLSSRHCTGWCMGCGNNFSEFEYRGQRPALQVSGMSYEPLKRASQDYSDDSSQ